MKTDVIPSGFPSLDALIGGWKNGHLIILGGRPCTGKSTFIQQVFQYAFAQHGIHSAVFRLDEFVTRDVNGNFCYASTLDVDELLEKTKESFRKDGVRLVSVDPISLVKASGSRDERRMGKVARMLKQAAVELNIPILVASGMKRSMFRRSDRTPRITDLHECKSITPYADEVLLFDGFRRIELMDKIFVNVVKNSEGPLREVSFDFSYDCPFSEFYE